MLEASVVIHFDTEQHQLFHVIQFELRNGSSRSKVYGKGLYIIFYLCVTLILVDLETPYSAERNIDNVGSIYHVMQWERRCHGSFSAHFSSYYIELSLQTCFVHAG